MTQIDHSDLQKKPRFTSFLMALVLLSSALIFPSVTIYLGNSDHFSMSLLSTMKIPLLLFLAGGIAALLLNSLLSERRRHISSLCFAGLSILVWVQGTILVWDYGLLDGRNLDWDEHQLIIWIDVLAWLVLVVVLVLVARKNSGFVIKGASAIFVLQLVATGVELAQAPVDQSDTPKSSDLETILGFSKNDNILHIVSDGFQSDVFEELIADPELKEQYNRSFDGFTYYRETLSMFPYTRFSIPAFLAGKIYSNEQVKNEYIDEALRGKTPMSLAREHGYEVDVVADDDYLIGRYANLPYDAIFNINDLPVLVDPLADSATLTDLTLFRVVPGPLKAHIYNGQKWFISRYLKNEEFLQFRYFTNTIFLLRFIEQMQLNREAPVYKFLHVMNTHFPMVVDAGCRYSGRAQSSTREALTLQSRCTMDTLSALLDKMKDLGIYDSTTIIVHGDHGGWVGNYRQGPDIFLRDGIVGEPWIKSLASPLLAIKARDMHGDITTSNVLASLVDLPDTISDIMGWDEKFGHVSLMDLQEGDARRRYFRYYRWQENAWGAEYTGPILEFSIDGSHYEAEWKAGRVFSPPQ
jgi:hypothetical protein